MKHEIYIFTIVMKHNININNLVLNFGQFAITTLHDVFVGKIALRTQIG